ncbi:MAG: universal stress protein [Bradymonadales bacterium]|nr:universal stress protein [Bradymonadales bacterium]
MIHRILLAHDFSGISERAQEYTLQIAGALGAKVLVLHAIEPFQNIEDQADDQFSTFLNTLKSKAEQKGEEILMAFREKEIDCDLQVVVEKRWQAVVKAAEEQDVDLVVLGSHAVHEDGKVYLGTTSHKVFFSTTKPLLVVPQG